MAKHSMIYSKAYVNTNTHFPYCRALTNAHMTSRKFNNHNFCIPEILKNQHCILLTSIFPKLDRKINLRKILRKKLFRKILLKY